MGLGQWIIIIVLFAIIIFGFAAVVSFLNGAFQNVYPQTQTEETENETSSSSSSLSTILKDTQGKFILSTVIRVIDGDTIQLAGGEKIRLALVNTPERYEYGYQAAKEWTEYRCLGNEAFIDLDDNQEKTYGRLVGMVYCDGYNVNLELFTLKLAVVMKNYCKYSEFKDSVICVS